MTESVRRGRGVQGCSPGLPQYRSLFLPSSFLRVEAVSDCKNWIMGAMKLEKQKASVKNIQLEDAGSPPLSLCEVHPRKNKLSSFFPTTV